MKKLFCAAALLFAACNSPVAPSRTEAQQPKATKWQSPLHHDIPAIGLDGTVVYLCETKPREYLVHGVNVGERDHYIQKGHCPVVPID